MKAIKSKAAERLIVDVEMNGNKYPMLVDTGATLSLISESVRGLLFDKRRRPMEMQGIGGKIYGKRVITTGLMGGRIVNQFLSTDISNIRESIEQETGIRIDGIIGLPQLKFAGAVIDTANNEILVPD